MYKIKTNKESKNLEMVKEQMNVHPLVIDQKKFDEIFTREFARFEYYLIDCKIANGEATSEDETKYNLIKNEIFQDNVTIGKCTDLSDVPEAIKPLMVLTLFAHNKLLKKVVCKDDDHKVVSELLKIGLDDFYKTCKSCIQDIENGIKTIENAVSEIKPLYNGAAGLIDTPEAIKGVCKKWTQSTKEKETRVFITGLLSKYRLTRFNRIKTDSPLKSLESFEKYFAMWIVTNGEFVKNSKKTGKDVKMFSSYCNKK